jgi:hypothetical protein
MSGPFPSTFAAEIARLTGAPLRDGDIRPLSANGLTHDHYTLGDTDWLLRVPRRNQHGMSPADYLSFQKDCYAAAAVSGATPRCAGIIAPSAEQPNGALIVQFIKGAHAPSSPDDFTSVAEAMASLQGVSSAGASAHVKRPEKPFGSIWPVVDYFYTGFIKDQPAIHEDTRRLMAAEMSALDQKISRLTWDMGVPFGLIGSDSHLGNQIVDPKGKAWIVDLEYLSLDVPHIDPAEAAQSFTTHDFAMPADQRAPFLKAWSVASGMDQHPMNAELTEIAGRVMQMKTVAWLGYWSLQGKHENTMPPEVRERFDRQAEEYLRPETLAGLIRAPGVSMAAASVPKPANAPAPK